MNLKIRNWERWQSYRKDRGQPPWIKIHRALLRDPAWVALSDAQRGQLISIWMLAGDRGGLIPDSPSVVKQLCFMKHKPNLQAFIDQGFIEKPDANLTPERRQHDAPETEKRQRQSRDDKKDYYFEDGIIRLKKVDFEKWQDAFQNLDLKSELLSLSSWASTQPNWFFATKSALAKRNRTIKERIAQHAAQDSRPLTEQEKRAKFTRETGIV